MDTALLIAFITLIVTTMSLAITLYDRLFRRAKCKIEIEAAHLCKEKDRWRVYIRFNVYTKNKPITIRSVSLSKIHKNRHYYVTQFEKAYNGDAFASAKNDFLLPNMILQPDTYHRFILEAKFVPDVEVPQRYDWEESGWIMSFSYNSKSVIRTDVNMKILGKDKFIEAQKSILEESPTETQE